MDKGRAVPVLIIFLTLVVGGIVVIVFGESDVHQIGNNMIVAGTSFATGAGLMFIGGQNGKARSSKDSSPPPFSPRERNGRPITQRERDRER